jgi:hypothetical protein
MADNESTSSELRASSRALRFALVALVLGLSYPNIRLALALPNFQQIYTDMLGNKPLPAATTFIIHARTVLLLLSFAVPLLALLSLALRSLSKSTYLAGFLILAIFIQLFSTWHAVALPLFDIIQGMESTPPTPGQGR